MVASLYLRILIFFNTWWTHFFIWTYRM